MVSSNLAEQAPSEYYPENFSLSSIQVSCRSGASQRSFPRWLPPVKSSLQGISSHVLDDPDKDPERPAVLQQSPVWILHTLPPNVSNDQGLDRVLPRICPPDHELGPPPIYMSPAC